MTMGVGGPADRSEVARIVKRLDALQAHVQTLDPKAPCKRWVLVRMNACIARLEVLKFVNQPMEKI